jgi:hypothetical protein
MQAARRAAQMPQEGAMPERGKNDPAQMPVLIGASFAAMVLLVAAVSLLTMLH